MAVFATAAAVAPSSAQAAPRADRLLAPPSLCPGQGSWRAAPAVQEAAMHCLVGYARRAAGRGPLRRVSALDASAARKASDILRCGQFSHTACGRSFDHWIRAGGWRGRRWGENIAWGTNAAGRSTPRVTMSGWLASPAHRENLLATRYDQVGIGLVRGRFSGYSAGVWTQHFGGGRG